MPELSQEAYILIGRYVGNRADLATLCQVSKGFQHATERLLWNTLNLRDPEDTISICRILSTTPRVACLVDALSIAATEEASDSEESVEALPDDYWDTVAAALRRMTRLRFLTVHLEGASDASMAWILDGCTFQLRNFHCDFTWDNHLLTFLNGQTQLCDLYIIDFKENTSDDNASPFDIHSLPKLSILECTFTEAVTALVPNRPVVRVKTCFSKSGLEDKREEMKDLLAKLRLSRKHIRSLDLADASYNPDFSLELLAAVVNTFSTSNYLRYLGTLVLPIDGRERLSFYALLMKLHRLQCIEVEVSDWDPAPITPAALRALMLELRLYCPTVTRVVFIYEFDRVAMKMADSLCVLDNESNIESLWRDV
ncbi:hypothetical protein C8Q75DRAFT_435166 [Abortiporus biennis]|nr:hypothetical protein C8Q75DRAFT_435166 [Abortiporus biennis]